MKYIVGLLIILGFAHSGLCEIKNAEAFWIDKPVEDINTTIMVGFDEPTGASVAEDITDALTETNPANELLSDTLQTRYGRRTAP